MNRQLSQRTGVLYFLKGKSNIIKIGFSNNLNKRLKIIQSHCPEQLKIYHLIHNKTQSSETSLKRYFKKYKSHNEWFHLKGELKEFLNIMRNGTNRTFQYSL